MKTKSLILCVLTVSAVLLTGCTSTTYTDPSGATFKRVSFLNRQNIGKVEAKAGEKEKSFVIEGYSNEQTELAAAVASSVAKALTPAAK